MPTRKELEVYLDHRVVPVINTHGWMLQGVAPLLDDPDPGPPFLYTVGLTGFGLPELLAIGVSGGFFAQVLNLFAEKLVTGEWVAEHGRLYADPLWVGTLRLNGPIYPFDDVFSMNMAGNIYGPTDVNAYQVVWPDEQERYADEGGTEKKCSPILPTLTDRAVGLITNGRL